MYFHDIGSKYQNCNSHIKKRQGQLFYHFYSKIKGFDGQLFY
jgi:hypothetical protein